MQTWLRRTLYSSFAALSITGVLWIVLHYFLQRSDEFGTTPHPLQAPLLIIHGIAATAVVFLVGWIGGTHISKYWARGKRRVSGVALLVSLALLGITGLGSYYLTADAYRTVNAVLHEIAGGTAILFALCHWLFAARRTQPVANPTPHDLDASSLPFETNNVI